MPLYDRQCTACGAYRLDTLEPVTAPAVACLTCGGPTERVWLPSHVPSVRADSIPGGLVIEHLGHEPVTVYSWSERKRLIKETGHYEAVRHVGTPGSDKHPETVRWV